MRFALIILALLSLDPSHAWAGWPLPPLPCNVRILRALYKDSGLSDSMFFWQMKLRARLGAERLGLPKEEIGRRYERLAANRELTSLMQGISLTAGKPDTRFSVSGGWGNDFVFVPILPHWRKVSSNFDRLSIRLANARGLDPILAGQLFISDHVSLPDSGWVIATTETGGESSFATVKVTFFDYDMTPDGPFPRFVFTSPIDPKYTMLFYQQPRHLSPYQAEAILEDHFHFDTSLSDWGLFPAEKQSGHRLVEHAGFSGMYLDIHLGLMIDVLEAYGTPNVSAAVEKLMRFRNQFVDQPAREIAELGRFNIPPGSDPGAKTQIFYGLTVLLTDRPSKTVVAHSPRPPPRPGEKVNQPSFQVFQTGQGPAMRWLAEMARKTAEEWDRERGINQGPFDEPKRDPLRESYENLGLEVTHTETFMQGLPNGGHVMRCSRDRFLRRIIAYQLAHPETLLPAQRAKIQSVLETLNDD